jgi:hypothetical protein
MPSWKTRLFQDSFKDSRDLVWTSEATLLPTCESPWKPPSPRREEAGDSERLRGYATTHNLVSQGLTVPAHRDEDVLECLGGTPRSWLATPKLDKKDPALDCSGA